MDKKNRTEFGNEVYSLAKEISDLRRQLNDLNEKKEDWFKKKEGLKRYIKSLISQIRIVKSEKDEFNEAYGGLKEQRDRYNQRVKSLITKAKELNLQKIEELKKHNIKGNPSGLKEKIKELEYSIETEAYTFKKEKEVMEEIKKLRKKYNESKIINEIVEDMDKISEEIEKSKKIADEFHNKIKNNSKDGQSGYGEFMDISRRINAMKKEQEDAFKNFIKFKVEFEKVNNQLRNKLILVNKARGNLDQKRMKIEFKKKNKEIQLIRAKEKEVEEKLRKGKKLTTEDLIVFQREK